MKYDITALIYFKPIPIVTIGNVFKNKACRLTNRLRLESFFV